MWHKNSKAASESDINLHCVYNGHERRDATKYKRSIIISDAGYTGYARQIPDSKLLPRSIYDVLSLTQSSNDLQCFVRSSVDTMYNSKYYAATVDIWFAVSSVLM